MAGGRVPDLLSAAAARYGLALDAQALGRLERYVALVMRWQRIANLTAAGDAATFVREHVVDCLAVVPALADGALLDVGSGAGLPGVVIAICQPERPVTLLEARAKRARFLTQVAIELGLTRVSVVNARAESWRPAAPCAAIISRAFGSLAEFARATAGAQGPQTLLYAMKATLDAAELAACPGARRIALEVPGYRERCLVVMPAVALGARPDVP